ncbi:latherin-like [Oryctolagus cuniculus]|uniref:latherin-like n=1 Tax=Oryctolagus cuniculus TaxID=9986 RepID=UPI0007EE3C85
MLVVSALLLPCGLLALASAQGDPPAFSPQLTDALAQGLLQEGLLTRLQTGDLPTLLDYFFKHRLNLWAKPIHPHRDDRDADPGPSCFKPQVAPSSIPFCQHPEESKKVLLQEPRLLQLSLDRKPGSREVTLTIPLAFTMIVNSFLILDTITTEIRSDIHVQLALEKSSDGRDRLTSKDCSVSPEAVRIQTEFL